MIMCNVYAFVWMYVNVPIAQSNRIGKHGKMPVSELMATEKFMNSDFFFLSLPHSFYRTHPRSCPLEMLESSMGINFIFELLI